MSKGCYRFDSVTGVLDPEIPEQAIYEMKCLFGATTERAKRLFGGFITRQRHSVLRRLPKSQRIPQKPWVACVAATNRSTLVIAATMTD